MADSAIRVEASPAAAAAAAAPPAAAAAAAAIPDTNIVRVCGATAWCRSSICLSRGRTRSDPVADRTRAVRTTNWRNELLSVFTQDLSSFLGSLCLCTSGTASSFYLVRWAMPASEFPVEPGSSGEGRLHSFERPELVFYFPRARAKVPKCRQFAAG